MMRTWEWKDLQFRYEVRLEGERLDYEKRLRWGGSIPTGGVELAGSILRGSGSLQEGEERQTLQLSGFREQRLERRPYRGYSAFRMPVTIFAGIFCAVPVFVFRPEGKWGWKDWLLLLLAFGVGSFGTAEILARLFPHRMLVLAGEADAAGKRVEAALDVHSLREHEREDLERAIRDTLAASRGDQDRA